MNNVAYNRDCLEAMKEMPDEYYDLALCDPPYGIGAACMKRGNSAIQPDKTKKWDSAIPTQDYFNELFRVSKNQVIWGGNYFPLPPTRCFLIWDKGETMYGRSFSECEYAWTSFDASARLYKLSPNDAGRIHPTQKPARLYEWIITFCLNESYIKPGDKIADFWLGSGSSRIAAYNLGFDFTGFEIDKDYFEAQEARFAAHTAQINMFLQ